MKIIVGLGNPGEKYLGTRHNIGFETLDHLLKKYEPLKESSWDSSKKTKSLVKKLTINTIPTILAQPQTYMNNSGMAVNLLLEYYKVKPDDLIVIHDELDLPLGKLQIRFGGGSAGHNGIESIINTLKTDKFLRIRMGIGKPTRIDSSKFEAKNPHTVDRYVLEPFANGQRQEVRTMVKHVQKNLEMLLAHGIETFMSKYNVKA